MKKIIMILVLSVVYLLGADFAQLVEKARGTNKLILVSLEQEYCPYCERMEKSVLSKKDIKEIINKKYVFIKLDINKDEIPEHLTSRLTPTFYFLSNDGTQVLDMLKGLTKKSEFKFYLEEMYKQEMENN